MFIKNFTSIDLTVSINGSKITLKANDTTLVPDGILTLAQLQKMFGQEAVALATTGPSTSILANQQVVEVGKLYCTEQLTQIQDIRIWVGGTGATVDFYGSDSTTIPTTFTVMSCPSENVGISGICTMPAIPRYVAFKANAGTAEIVVTNLKLHEVSDIA